MTNVRPVQFRTEINGDLVEMLEDALAMARDGKLMSANICGTYANGDLYSSYSSTDNAILELAAVSRLLHRLQLRMDG